MAPRIQGFLGLVNDPENPYSWEKLLEEGPNSVSKFAAEWNKKANEIVSAEIASLGADD